MTMTYKEYREILNKEPLITAEVEKNKLGIKYGAGETLTEIPIQVLHRTLDFVYSDWYISKVEHKVDFNMLIVNVTVKALHPVTGEYFEFSGSAGDTYSKVETTNKIAKGESKGIISITQSMALKKACKPLGRIFGRDLNDDNDFSKEAEIEVKKIETIDEFSELNSLEKLTSKLQELETDNGLRAQALKIQIENKLNLLKKALKITDLESQKTEIERLGLDYELVLSDIEKMKANGKSKK